MLSWNNIFLLIEKSLLEKQIYWKKSNEEIKNQKSKIKIKERNKQPEII